MKVLLTGAQGQVGGELCRLALETNTTMIGLGHAELDIEDSGSVSAAIQSYQPDVVINAAAYTAVDRAEGEPNRALAVNREGAANLARVCRDGRIPLIHFSTDYVFDGSQRRPYRETDAPAPLNAYGASKWEGEAAVREIYPGSLVLRLSWVFSSRGHNFVKTILGLARDREELRIVNDQIGCPTAASDIAKLVMQLLLRPPGGTMPCGVYHYASGPATTWYGFCQTILKAARESNCPLAIRRVVPISTADFITAATRPAYSVLDCARVEALLGQLCPSWQEALHQVVAEIALGKSTT